MVLKGHERILLQLASSGPLPESTDLFIARVFLGTTA